MEDPLKEVGTAFIYKINICQFENDELFKKVLHISNMITSNSHTEAENEEIINYLKTLSGLLGKCDHLNKNLSKKVIYPLE